MGITPLTFIAEWWFRGFVYLDLILKRRWSMEPRVKKQTDDSAAPGAPEDRGLAGGGGNGSAPQASEPTPDQTGRGPDARIAAMEAELASLKDQLLRARAECANIARRAAEQQVEAVKLAGMGLARSLLPVMDSLDRMLSSLPRGANSDPFAEGVRLIAEELRKVLRDHGIVPIHAVGRKFDPTSHEAMLQDRDSNAPPGTVTRELQRGYMMHDRVLRPAKVAVSAASEEKDGG